jgi:lipoate-protein ligase A
MDYYFLDKVSWEHSQALYHAAAYLGREALFILRPATPYVCIGFHQDAEQEVEAFYANNSVETLGVKPADFVRVLLPA